MAFPPALFGSPEECLRKVGPQFSLNCSADEFPYPSTQEAEYTACLAFAIATSVSLWAVRMGFGYTQNVPS